MSRPPTGLEEEVRQRTQEVRERMLEVAKRVPPGPDYAWRLDAALGEFVARRAGIWEPGRTYTVFGPAGKLRQLERRVRRIERHLGLTPED
jgi:hypothetical protein